MQDRDRPWKENIRNGKESHPNKHHRVAMCGRMFLNPMLHLGPQKQWSQKFLKTAIQRPCRA